MGKRLLKTITLKELKIGRKIRTNGSTSAISYVDGTIEARIDDVTDDYVYVSGFYTSFDGLTVTGCIRHPIIRNGPHWIQFIDGLVVDIEGAVTINPPTETQINPI